MSRTLRFNVCCRRAATAEGWSRIIVNDIVSGRYDGSGAQRGVEMCAQAIPAEDHVGNSTDEPGRGDELLMQRRRVCGIDEIPPGTMKLVPAGKFGVGV